MEGTSRQTRLFMVDSPNVTSEHVPHTFSAIAVMFVTSLLISNIVTAKATALDAGPVHPVFDGDMILFSLTYVLDDVLSEVYDFTRAKRVIILGFITPVLAPLTFLLVRIAPIGPGCENQAAFEAVLGFVSRTIVASIIGYLVGQLMDSLVLVKIRQRQGAECLWARLTGSTLLDEALDTVLLYTIAFMGIIPGRDFFNYVLTGYIYKVGVKTVLLSITYRVVALMGKHEGLKPEEVPAA